MIACGCLCALVKLTTFCAFCFPCLILPILEWRSFGSGDRTWAGKALLRPSAVLGAAFGIPLAAGMLWTRHADAVKAAAPGTRELVSSDYFMDWIFGTMAQRLDPSAWLDLLASLSLALTFYPLLIVVFGALFFLQRRDRWITFLFLAAGIIPPVVFFNVYIVHDYYFYASSIFLLLAIGYMLACLAKVSAGWSSVLWLTVAAALGLMYSSFMFKVQWGRNEKMAAVIELIASNTKPDDILLIYGEYCDPTITYHSKRRSFMNYKYTSSEMRAFDANLAGLEGWNKVRLAVVNTRTVSLQPYLQERLKSLGFPEKPDMVYDEYSIYRRQQDAGGKP
jgi:hypothetical protein